MIYDFMQELDGSFVRLEDIFKNRYEVLMKKKNEVGLSGDELKELQHNKYYKMIQRNLKETIYAKIAFEHSLKKKGFSDV